MMPNSIYLIQLSLAWGLLFLFYLLFLRKATFFKWNRYFLLGALLVGLLLPFAQAIMQQVEVGLHVVQLPVLTITNQEATEIATTEEVNDTALNNWLSVVYWFGVAVMVLRLLRDLVGMVWLVHGSEKEKYDGLTLVHIQQDMAPFSFFNYLFVFDRERFSEEEWSQVLAHEKTHIHQSHTLDILFTEVLKIVFWWNPLVYLYQYALREVHEYEADRAIKQPNNIKQYGLLLIKQSLSGNQVAIANSFINSQLKKRIMMMTKNRSTSLTKLRYFWSFPLLTGLLFISFGQEVLAQKEGPKIAQEHLDTIVTFDMDTYEEKIQIVRSVVYSNQNLDKPAILIACDGEDNEQQCSNRKLMEALFEHIDYPEEARVAGMEGMAVVKIVCDYLSNVTYELVKDPGFGMGTEVIRALNAANLKWRPASLDGKQVNTESILPVKFKLDDNGSSGKDDMITSAFQDIRTHHSGSQLRVDFNYTGGQDAIKRIKVYDLKGQQLFADSGSNNFFEVEMLTTAATVLILTLYDDAGNKAVRKVLPMD